MSETAGTIIKLLSALTSPKASVKYLSVALFLFISWKYFEAGLKDAGIPKEQLSIIIILIGLGLGSLAGHIIVFFGEIIWNKYTIKKEEKERLKEEEDEKEKAKIEKDEKDEAFIRRFKISFPHLHTEQKRILRSLTIENKNLDLLDSEISALNDNGYIKSILNVSSTTYLMAINPLLTEYVSNQWKAEVNSRIDELYNDNSIPAEELLEILKYSNKEKETPIKSSLIEGLSEYSGCIRVNADTETEGYWLWFDFDIREALEVRNNEEYIDELYIPKSRLQ